MSAERCTLTEGRAEAWSARATSWRPPTLGPAFCKEAESLEPATLHHSYVESNGESRKASLRNRVRARELGNDTKPATRGRRERSLRMCTRRADWAGR